MCVPEEEVDPASEKWLSFYNKGDANAENKKGTYKCNTTSSKP